MTLALIVVFVLAVYFCINIARLSESRINSERIKSVWGRTSAWLIAMSLTALFFGIAANSTSNDLSNGIYMFAGIQLVVAFTILVTTLDNLRASTPAKITKNFTDEELPTVSVCIPARNESIDLQDCLEGILKSNYPKLEILVLDDCSQDRRTPEIIRQFAQDGVKFIAGKVPPEKWLAKNYAYEQLSAQANGDILLFCGVDCRFQESTISNSVKLFLQENTKMISILPKNIIKNDRNFGQALIQPARYAWELALPRRFVNRPPVLSTSWLITSEAFSSLGGFEGICRKPVPESFFATALSKNQNNYKFIISDSTIGLSSTKNFSEQKATAIRTRYPQLHRRPELVALLSLAETSQLLWPFGIAVAGIVSQRPILTLISGAAALVNTFVYAIIVNIAYRRFVWSGLIALPFAAMYDVLLLNYSMWQYEFGEVLWKGRNICLPVMQAIPSLPRLSDDIPNSVQRPQK